MKKTLLTLSTTVLLSLPTSAALANENNDSPEMPTVQENTPAEQELISVEWDEESEVELIPVENEDAITNEEEKGSPFQRILVVDPKQTFTVAWGKGTKIVKDDYGHLFTAELMAKSHNGQTDTVTYEAFSRPSNLISADSSFKKIVSDFVTKTKKAKKTKDSTSGSSAFNTGELYTSLHNYNYSLDVNYNPQTKKWHYKGIIRDRYDFVWSKYNATYKGFKVTVANNVAAAGVKAGYLSEFDVKIFVAGDL
ncbi:hypothetical protein LSPCS325_53610 [Lysinibacillus sp. CTST325]